MKKNKRKQTKPMVVECKTDPNLTHMQKVT